MTGLAVKRVTSPSGLDATTVTALFILIAMAAAVLLRQTFVSLAVILVLVGLSAFRPAAALAGIPAVIGFVLQPVRISGLRFSPQEVLLACTIAGVGFNVLWLGWTHGPVVSTRSLIETIRRRRLPVDVVAILFLLVGTLSLATIAMPAYRHESIRDYRWTILEPIIFYLLARWYYQDRATRGLAALLFVAGAMLVAVTGVVGLITGHGLSVEGVTRVSGVYDHPNALALFLERPLVVAVGLAAVYRTNLKWRWIFPATVIGAVLVMTFSRGAVLAAGVAIILVLLVGQRKRLAGLASLGGIALLAVLAATASARFDNLFSGGSGSLRIDLWKASVRMIRDHPIFGIGPDQFLYVYAPRYIKPGAWSERFTSHPHNIVLDIWLRLGIMGLVLALAYLAILAWMTVHVVHRRRAIGLAASGALVVGMLHGLVDNGYFLPDLALIFWFLTAMVAVEAQDESVDATRHT